MRIFQGFASLPDFGRAAATIGSFDGVHAGHRALLERLTDEARATGGESVVLTFEPHPRIALGRAYGLRLLTPLDEKIELLAQIGVDNLIVIPFDRSFSALSGREFIERYICGTVGAETLIVGYNHRFGHDRIGADEIEAQGIIRVVRVAECRVDDRHVSSTVIRRLLDEGRAEEAERLLGHSIRKS
ncbi:FAD synthetase family protein [uncultured Alistipes sp.]|jgi:riboflavin kinase/FMN adenylyltransferase|uniref:FAD synthetase family protein n=1 Tax=uncultured Alistipes sp. TaxID=538949 RepID=UPI0023BB4FAE|nr:FAD synthetase family protein [uncultured Alistipes sp.]MDE7005318.1 FAD synthetase family protein [Alistipes sp.]